jgi:hypothetical protein
MAPNAINHPDPTASPTRDETLLNPFQPKTKTDQYPHSLSLGKPPATQTERIAPPPITSSVDNYPSDSSDALKIFNQTLLHTHHQGSHLTAISDLTFEQGCKTNEEWATGPEKNPVKRDETDHIAIIIKLKMQLALAQAKNDQLALLLRQCTAEKMDLECEMRASLRRSNEPTKSRPAHNRHHSFHAPSSYQPTNNMQRVHPTAHVHRTHESIIWHEETITTNVRPNKINYIDKLMTQKFRDGGVKVVTHK